MFVNLPIWMRRRFAVIRRGPAVAIVRVDFAGALEASGLLDDPAGRDTQETPGAASRGALSEGGRGATYLLETGTLGSAVIRPYRRGGLVRHVNRRRYFFGNRAYDELVTTERLRRWGLPVPEPLAAVQFRRAGGYEAVLATRWIPGALPAARALRNVDAAAAETYLRAAARSIGRLHEAGSWHADLNAHNILLPAGPGPAVVIDFDRCRLLPPPLPAFLARRNLRRLRRSLAKLGLDAALSVWEAFEEEYRAHGPAEEYRQGANSELARHQSFRSR